MRRSGGNRSDHQRRARHRVLRIEVLRERITLDGAGLGVSSPLPWFDPGALTYSFANDGTDVAGQASRLSATLSEIPQWQDEFDAAFHTWLAPLGASIQHVADSGNRFGVAGRTQGDARFGDVRIAAIPLSQGVLATSIPHSAMVQGTWAGDILINSEASWETPAEIFAVALHEFGHVLGLTHSTDPLSPMFIHGAPDAVVPTTADIETLRDLYFGIQFEDESDHDRVESADAGEPARTVFPGSESVSFDPASAIDLTAAIGSTLRYSAAGTIADSETPVVYRLDPTAREPEGLENLLIALQSTGPGRLISDVSVYDSAGGKITSRVLHHGQGSVIIQAHGIESKETHYVVVSSAPGIHPSSRIGSFEIVMDYSPELRSSRDIGEVTLSSETPAFDQQVTVASSRLVHMHLDSEGKVDLDTAVVVRLVDDAGAVITAAVIHPGTSRSAPLAFLTAGNYTLRYHLISQSETSPETQLKVHLDELSLDVGPIIADPTDGPYLPCEEPGADPMYCYQYTPISPQPLVGNPMPAEEVYPWWFEYGFTCDDYDAGRTSIEDPLWWDFYVEVCEPTTPADPPPTGPPPTSPPPTSPPPASPPPASPTQSPLQNLQDPSDVSNDARVSARDALIVINLLAQFDGSSVAVTDSSLAGSPFYADVNGDFMITALDALVVINTIRLMQLAAAAEGVAVLGYTPNVDPLVDASDEASRNDPAIGRLF